MLAIEGNGILLWKEGERSHVHEYFEWDSGWIHPIDLLIVQGTAKGKSTVCIPLRNLIYISFNVCIQERSIYCTDSKIRCS